MDRSTASADGQTHQIGALISAYSALNRSDVDGFVRDFEPDVLRVEFEGSQSEGTFSGLAAVREHVRRGRSTWAEGTCEPQEFTQVGDKIVVTIHVRVRLNDQVDWLEGQTGDVFTFHDGKVIEFRTFYSPADALQWAGSTSP